MAEPTSTTALVAKTAVTTLTDERLRKGRAWTTGLLLLPVILISMLICSLFLGNISEDYQEYIGDMRDGFRLLDGTIDSMNNEMEDGDRLDSIRVKAIFYAPIFGTESPSGVEHRQFEKNLPPTRTDDRIAREAREKETRSKRPRPEARMVNHSQEISGEMS